MAGELYELGAFTLDPAERRLSANGREIPLPPKAHELLLALVRRAGHVVSKQELLDAVWPDAFVEQGILAVHISSLRKALGSPEWIDTVPRLGYRYAGPVKRVEVIHATAIANALGTSSLLRPIRAEVYEWFGRGRCHVLSASRAEVPKAIAAFEAAIELEPTYAAAHAGLALACCAKASLRLAPPAEAYAGAKSAALRALAMDDRSADAQAALGVVLFLSEWDWAGADRSLRRALELNPNHTEGYLYYGQLREALRDLETGLAMKMRALERDPLSPMVHLQIALGYFHQRRYRESIEWARKALDLDPRHLMGREQMAAAYWKLGDYDNFMAENIRHAECFGVAPEALDPLKRAYSAEGHTGVVKLFLEQAEAQPGAFPAMQLAIQYGEVGNLDAAFLNLNRAIDSRDPCLVHLAVAPQWDALRSDTRFAECLRRMGLAAA